MADNKVIVDVQLETDDVEGKLDNVKKKADDTSESFGLMDTNIGKTFSGIVSGAKKGISSMKTLKGAIVASGVGLLVIAVSSLVAWFTKTERGAQKLRVIMATFNAVISELTDIAISLGETLFNIFSNPKQAIKDLWEAIKTNVINRFTGLLDTFGAVGRAIKAAFTFDGEGFKKAVGEAGESIVQSVTGVDELGKKLKGVYDGVVEKVKEIADDVQKATDLQERENALIVRKRGFLTEEAQLRQDIAKQLLIEADVTKTNAERAAAIEESIRLQNVLSDKKVAIAKEELAIVEERNALGESTEEDKEREKVLAAELINLETERFEKSKEGITKLSGFKKTIADQEAADKKEREEQDEEDAQTEIDRVAGVAEEIRLAEEERYLLSLETDAERKQAELDLEAQHQRDLLDQRLAAGEINAEEFQSLVDAANAVAIRKQHLFNLEKKLLDEKDEAERKKIQKAIDDAKEAEAIAINNALFNLAIGFSNLIAGIAEDNKAAAISALLVEKAVAVASIIMNTKKAVAVAIGTPPGTFTGGMPWSGIALAQGILGVSTVVASAAKGIQDINAASATPPAPKMALGGFISGPSHAMGGVGIEAEGGEFMINKTSMSNPQLAAQAVAINDAGIAGTEVGGLTEARVVEIASQVVKSVPAIMSDTQAEEVRTKRTTRESRMIY